MGKRRQFHQGGKGKRPKYELQSGMSGFLVTFGTGKERPCRTEAYALLNSHANRIYGPEQTCTTKNETPESDSDDDIEKALEKERDLEVATKANGATQRRFHIVPSGSNHSLFVRTTLGNPTRLFASILEAVTSPPDSQQSCSDYIQCQHLLRIIPITTTCRADRDKIASAIEGALHTTTFVSRGSSKTNVDSSKDGAPKVSSGEAPGPIASPVHATDVPAEPSPSLTTAEAEPEAEVATSQPLPVAMPAATPARTHCSFCVLFKRSNSNMFTRNEAITVATEVMKQANPLNYVDLVSPDVFIYIEVVRSVACIGILRDYYKYKKYNMQELTVSRCLSMAKESG